MSTGIKDKPLKKIVCDTRTTIDNIHTKKLQYLKKEINEQCGLENDMGNLKERINSSEGQDKINCENELNLLKNKSNKINKNAHVEYYLDNGLILSDYYSGETNYVGDDRSQIPTKKKTVVDYMNDDEHVVSELNNNYTHMINDYMASIDDEFLHNFNLSDINLCKHCKMKLNLEFIKSELICSSCGYTEKIIINLDGNSYKDPIRESTYFAYKRINHFNEWLAQFQSKESCDVSEDIYNNIIKELKKDKNFNIKNLSYKMIRDILKKLKYNKYYEHIAHIYNVISGEKTPILTRANEEQLRIMFKEIQQPFCENCPPERKNFLSYSYVLHKFCELLELDHLLCAFPLLKSREKLQQQDVIWKKICKDLKWQYIPSV